MTIATVRPTSFLVVFTFVLLMLAGVAGPFSMAAVSLDAPYSYVATDDEEGGEEEEEPIIIGGYQFAATGEEEGEEEEEEPIIIGGYQLA